MTNDGKQADKAAVERVNQMISDYRTKIEAITLLKEDASPNPITVEGETKAGYYCCLMVDPRDVAPVLLKYDYPIYRILGEDAPNQMWRELGEQFGLAEVSSFDL